MSTTDPMRLRLFSDESELSDIAAPDLDSIRTDVDFSYGDLEAWLLAEPGAELDGVEIPRMVGHDRAIGPSHSEEAPPTIVFTSRLTSIVRGAVEGIGCDAAVLYVLDDATTELAMQAMWGLPPERCRRFLR